MAPIHRNNPGILIRDNARETVNYSFWYRMISFSDSSDIFCKLHRVKIDWNKASSSCSSK
jgi:hypothetical protein